MKTLLPIAIGLILSYSSWSQGEIYELPLYFGQFFNDPQNNPVHPLKEHDRAVNVRLGYRQNSSVFGGVNTSFAACEFQTRDNKGRGHHSMGLILNADREGPLIRRNRVYGFYGRHLRISESMILAGGISGGIYNFGVKATASTGGFSATTFDGGFGFSLYTDQFHGGLSLNQFARSEVRPVQQVIVLSRHVNFTAGYRWELNSDFELLPDIYVRYGRLSYLPGNNTTLTVSMRTLIRQHIMAGLSYETSNGSYLFLGVSNLKIASSELGIDLAHFVPGERSLRANTQLFELTISYLIK